MTDNLTTLDEEFMSWITEEVTRHYQIEELSRYDYIVLGHKVSETIDIAVYSTVRALSPPYRWLDLQICSELRKIGAGRPQFRETEDYKIVQNCLEFYGMEELFSKGQLIYHELDGVLFDVSSLSRRVLWMWT